MQFPLCACPFVLAHRICFLRFVCLLAGMGDQWLRGVEESARVAVEAPGEQESAARVAVEVPREQESTPGKQDSASSEQESVA